MNIVDGVAPVLNKKVVDVFRRDVVVSTLAHELHNVAGGAQRTFLDLTSCIDPRGGVQAWQGASFVMGFGSDGCAQVGERIRSKPNAPSFPPAFLDS